MTVETPERRPNGQLILLRDRLSDLHLQALAIRELFKFHRTHCDIVDPNDKAARALERLFKLHCKQCGARMDDANDLARGKPLDENLSALEQLEPEQS